MSELRPDQAACPLRRPVVQTEEAGATRWWCSCGRSQSQPFCDGSHAGTAFTPVETTCPTKKPYAWCGCKATKTPPFCDGSHSRLP